MHEYKDKVVHKCRIIFVIGHFLRFNFCIASLKTWSEITCYEMIKYYWKQQVYRDLSDSGSINVDFSLRGRQTEVLLWMAFLRERNLLLFDNIYIYQKKVLLLAMHAQRGRGDSVPLTSALVGGEWSPSRYRALPLEMTPRYPLDRRLGKPQSWSGHRIEDKSFASAGYRTPVV
jgi:hypothetical protein